MPASSIALTRTSWMRSPVPSVSNRTFVEYSSMTNGATAFLLGFATGDFRGAAVCACDVRGAAKNKVTHAAKQIVANEIFVVILVIGAAGTRCEWILISASCSLVSFYQLVKHRVRESFHKDSLPYVWTRTCARVTGRLPAGNSLRSAGAKLLECWRPNVGCQRPHNGSC